MILEPVGDDMDDVALALDGAVDGDHRRRHHDPALRLELALPQDDVGDSGLVLDGDEGDVALARPLADQDQAGDQDLRAVLDARPDRRSGMIPMPVQLGPQESRPDGRGAIA